MCLRESAFPGAEAPFCHEMYQQQEREKDMRKMQTYYSSHAARIQELVMQECDRMEYDGSMMFDEYPDKLMMENLCRKVEDRYYDQEGEGAAPIQAMHRNRSNEVRDLIGVLLFNEMFCRRCRHRHRRNYYY